MLYSLQIHHIGISGGDATMIRVRRRGSQESVCKVLIDAGGEGYHRGHTTLNGYLADFATEPFDYIITSHYHADHIAGFALSSIPFKRFIDMGGYATGNNRFDPVNQLGDLSNDSGTVQQYQYYIHSKVGDDQKRRVDLPFLRKENFDAAGMLKSSAAGPVRLQLVTDAPIFLTCYCAGGVLADGTNALRISIGKRRLRQLKEIIHDDQLTVQGVVVRKEGQELNETHLSDKGKQALARDVDLEMAKVSPNDLSLAFILEWDNFRYFTAGDLSGDLSMLRYANMEEPLITYLRNRGELNANTKPITVMKATHHGSNHNNYPATVLRTIPGKTAKINEEDDADDPTGKKQSFMSERGIGLLEELGPTTIIVSANQMKGVPGGEFIERVRGYCVKRNKAISLSLEVIDALKKIKFNKVRETYPKFADQLSQLTTIAFINELSYPQASYKDKQKANWIDFFGLTNAVPRTNVVAGDGQAKGSMPRAVVVLYPVPNIRFTKIKDTTELMVKNSHLVAIDGRPRQYGKTQRAETPVKLTPLFGKDLELVRDNLQNQLDLLGQMLARDTETGKRKGIEFAAHHYPSLVSWDGEQNTLNPAAATRATLEELFDHAYPYQDRYGTHLPQEDGLTFNDRRTIATLIRQTPGEKKPDWSILGQDPYLLPYNISRPVDKPEGSGESESDGELSDNMSEDSGEAKSEESESDESESDEDFSLRKRKAPHRLKNQPPKRRKIEITEEKS